MKVHCNSHEYILLPYYAYNMHQDTKSARLIAVCKSYLYLSVHIWHEFQENVKHAGDQSI